MTENYKIIKDSVHGLIDLKPIIVKIIDTPEFQRLRHLKQLESLSYIYPCAVHTRFEHSIGTSYLARQFIEHLQKNQPELNITRKDALCVEIAGLCHDLGHGPFSHLFEDLIKKVYKKRQPDASKSEVENFFVHEQASVLIFDKIFTKLQSSPEFQEENLTSKDKELIKELINPTIVKEIADKYKILAKEKKSDTVKNGKAAIKKKQKILSEKLGIKVDKSFLFEIVSNFRNKIDVDKWDYFARDALHLGIQTTFDYKRYILTSRVINPDNTLNQICARDKELRNVYEMFRTREDLHRRAYQLPKAIGVKLMIIDTLVELDDVVDFYGIIENIQEDLDGYLRLDDRIIYLTSGAFDNLLNIDENKKKYLEKAKKLVQRLESRKLYKCLCTRLIKKEKIEKPSLEKTKDILLEKFQQLDQDDFSIIESRVNFGNKDKDPLEWLHFYAKNSNKIVTKEDIWEYNSEMRPQIFEQITWNFYLKNENLLNDALFIKELKDEFDKICTNINLSV